MTDGRTYMIKSVEKNPNYRSELDAYWQSDNRYHVFHNPNGIHKPDEFLFVETPYVVPNGKWVIEDNNVTYAQLVGSNVGAIERVSLGRNQRTLYIADDPFGLVKWDKDIIHIEMQDAEQLTLVSARQIHKGELGQHVSIPKVRFTAEPVLGPELGATNGDRQRARMGWVRLIDLTLELHTTQIELMERYIQFGLNRYSSKKRAMVLEMIVNPWQEHILDGNHEIKELTRTEVFEKIRNSYHWHLWVRRGFANTVLRPAALNFTFESANA